MRLQIAPSREGSFVTLPNLVEVKAAGDCGCMTNTTYALLFCPDSLLGLCHTLHDCRNCDLKTVDVARPPHITVLVI
jgi:hypothetical protein